MQSVNISVSSNLIIIKQLGINSNDHHPLIVDKLCAS